MRQLKQMIITTLILVLTFSLIGCSSGQDLIEAVKNDDAAEVRKLIEEGVKLDATDDVGRTPLELAEERRNEEIYSMLELAGREEISEEALSSNLLGIVRSGHLELTKMMVNRGADVNVSASYNDQLTPLIVASKRNHPEIAEFLIEEGANINVKDNKTALMWSTHYGNEEIVKKLLDEGAKVNAASYDNNWTALMYAAREGYPEIAKTLLDAGADINIRNNEGRDPLYIAERHDNSQVAKLLEEIKEENIEKAEALISAVEDEDLEAVEEIIDEGANPNAADENGVTSLMWAAYSGNLKIAELLVSEGANVNAITENGVTALMAAAEEGHPHIVRFLIENGAERSRDSRGYTALDIAKHNENYEVVELFKIALDRRDKASLIEAIANRYTEAAKLLIDRGADVNAQEGSHTPLSAAAFIDNKELVEKLISAGADVNAPTKEGGTALMIAAGKAGNPEIAKTLLDAGADVNAELYDGTTALSLARNFNNPEIVEILKNAGAEE